MDISDTADKDKSFFHYVYDGEDSFLQIAVTDGLDDISLLISAKTGALPQTKPKALKEEIWRVVDQPESIDTIRRTRLGKLLIVTKSTQTAQSVLNVTSLLNIPVDAYVIKDTISSRFLLRNIDTDIPCAEIAEELRLSGVLALEVRRFLRKTDDSTVPTTTVLVTKVGTTLPASVKLWHQNFRISPFWDTPRACRKCFHFNHSTASCRVPPRCHRCGEIHDDVCTALVPKCLNCKGEHDALDKACPRYQREVEIQKYKSRHHLTTGEARRRYSEIVKSKEPTFAQVVSTPAAPPPVAPNYITKSDLEHSFQSLAETLTTALSQSITHILQEFLETQQRTLRGLLDEFSTALRQNIEAAHNSLASSIASLSTPPPSFNLWTRT